MKCDQSDTSWIDIGTLPSDMDTIRYLVAAKLIPSQHSKLAMAYFYYFTHTWHCTFC